MADSAQMANGYVSYKFAADCPTALKFGTMAHYSSREVAELLNLYAVVALWDS